MSRTYRKNHRWIEKYQGEFYSCTYYNSRSAKYPFEVKDNRNLQMGNSWSRIEVRVCDADNHGKFYGMSRSLKRMHHRIDRARYKQALLRNQDSFIVPSFDPWDWD
jgi:hypothetical protein